MQPVKKIQRDRTKFRHDPTQASDVYRSRTRFPWRCGQAIYSGDLFPHRRFGATQMARKTECRVLCYRRGFRDGGRVCPPVRLPGSICAAADTAKPHHQRRREDLFRAELRVSDKVLCVAVFSDDCHCASSVNPDLSLMLGSPSATRNESRCFRTAAYRSSIRSHESLMLT